MINVTVYDKKLKKRVMEAAEGESLMQLLGRYQVYFDANCGGGGNCRQCEVLVDGVRRRACKYTVTHACKVVLPFVFADGMNTILSGKSAQEEKADSFYIEEYYMCIDLGTTTIGMALLAPNRRVVAEIGLENSQRAFGADVAARIQYASTKEGLQQLQELVVQDIIKGKQQLLEKMKVSSDRSLDCYISGNTTMLHILGGVSPKSIGRYPFTPEHPEYRVIKEKRIGTLHLLPCASGYIGSDVTVGAFFYRLHHKEQPCLFLDLGTNGEMILGDRNHMLSTSVAAGPAFEKVLKGADGLHLLAQMREKGIINQHGTLSDVYLETGYISAGVTITQDTIRELQLAKGAVRAGIEILCHRFGCKVAEVERVYIAGGFGFYLKEEDAFFLDMFPEEFQGKVEVVGNSSLNGTIACHDRIDELQKFNESILNIDLSMDAQFQEKYVQYMEF